jgi:hypothetical protein
LKVSRAVRALLVAGVSASLLSGCLRYNVQQLASDAMAGRNNNTPGGELARDWIIGILDDSTEGAIPGETGADAFKQTFPDGVNVLSKITGTTRPGEYVIIGAHYDHHGSCGNVGGDTICNGATDNATGVAMVIEMAERFAVDPPDRTVVFALWDAEEDGLKGSNYYVNNPVVPLASTVAYINLDIQGANLLPTLRNHTFAIGAGSGGAVLESVVDAAYAGSTLDGQQLSAIFGLFRSDYANFLGKSVPTVFFSDSTGPCYHTPKDEFEIVDWDKLDAQTEVLYETAVALAYDDPSSPGTFITPQWEARPTVVFEDVVRLLDVIETSLPDWDRFPTDLRDEGELHRANLAQIVADGPEAFDDADFGTVLLAANSAVTMLTYGDCDGFLD